MRKDKKKRAPCRQPICGLWAAARCCGIRLDTAEKTQSFRNRLLVNNIIHRNGNWVGGTNDDERNRICSFLGFAVEDMFRDLIHKKGPETTITVKTLLNSVAFFKTREQYMLCVDQHVLYVKTNIMRRKLWVSDQRGKPMRVIRKGTNGPDFELESMLGRHVVSVCAVRKN